MKPGFTPFTVMPRGPSSSARVRTRLSTPALAAPSMPWPGMAWEPAEPREAADPRDGDAAPRPRHEPRRLLHRGHEALDGDRQRPPHIVRLLLEHGTEGGGGRGGHQEGHAPEALGHAP